LDVKESERDGTRTTQRYFVVRPAKAGGFTLEKLIEFSEPDSARTKVGLMHQVTLTGQRVTERATTEFGYEHVRVWDLGAVPAQLVEEQEGGAQACREAMEVRGESYQDAEAAGPRCTTDGRAGRRSCVRDEQRCDDAGPPIRQMYYVPVPLHAVGATLMVPEPLGCAARIGARPEEVLLGPNRRRTTFRVVGIDDAARRRLELVMMAEDRTPRPAPSVGSDGRGYDHWELELASELPGAGCVPAGGRAAYCEAQARVRRARFAVVPLAGGMARVAALGPEQGMLGSSAPTARREGGRVIVTLEGELYDWAHQGGIALAYHDAGAGQKPVVIATAAPRHVPGNPAARGLSAPLGQLDGTMPCDGRQSASTVESIPPE
jgi:hypothetical protein